MAAKAETNAHQPSIVLVFLNEDDYIMVRELLCEAKGVRFDLEWATTYEAALKAIKRNRYDACLVDYHLGERSGLEFLHEIVGEGYRAPVIMLTAEGEHEAGLEAMDAGAVDYLTREQIEAPLLERSVRYVVECKRAEERFHSLVQNASDIITVLEADGTIYATRALPSNGCWATTPRSWSGRASSTMSTRATQRGCSEHSPRVWVSPGPIYFWNSGFATRTAPGAILRSAARTGWTSRA